MSDIYSSPIEAFNELKEQIAMAIDRGHFHMASLMLQRNTELVDHIVWLRVRDILPEGSSSSVIEEATTQQIGEKVLAELGNPAQLAFPVRPPELPFNYA